MPPVHDLPPDTKANRPRSRDEAISLIEETFTDKKNDWDEGLQVIYLAELNLKPEWKKLADPENKSDSQKDADKVKLSEILKKWREFDNTLLKRILLDMEKHRMILFK